MSFKCSNTILNSMVRFAALACCSMHTVVTSLEMMLPGRHLVACALPHGRPVLSPLTLFPISLLAYATPLPQTCHLQHKQHKFWAPSRLSCVSAMELALLPAVHRWACSCMALSGATGSVRQSAVSGLLAVWGVSERQHSSQLPHQDISPPELCGSHA